ncbi:MAG: hypothetical protein K9M54_07000 [Kiritimatiellales bacterium]|nr:hypothetical protein [Kiritimatiellales bacterium]MCF7863799.1 hypothetical protein [Kiritimatiellales bacterium]
MARYGFLAGIAAVLMVVSVCGAAEIVVLTETPVAEFSLPDGSVLTNAYVWRRSSEGLMVMHDGGNYFLNYKLLPDDWRVAYGLEASGLAQAPSRPVARDDMYLIHPILLRVPGLSHTAYGFFTSTRYAGEIDEILLSACMLQSLCDGKYDKAARLRQILSEKFSEKNPLADAEFFATCDACGGSGTISYACNICGGSGKCIRCDGTGERKSDLTGTAIHCTTCRGTGKCFKCKASGKLGMQCADCKGLGKVFESEKAKEELAGLVEQMNAFYSSRRP